MSATNAQPDPAAGEHLQRAALSDQVKEFIVEAILAGEYKPGDRIVESALARRLGVSQAPVREAIRDLVLLGFLETEHYRGTSVRAFTPKELWEAYAVRAALESLAARLAAPQVTDADGFVLEGILAEMLEAGHARDQERLIRLDNEFHETVMRLAQNQLLYQLWKTLEFARWTIYTFRTSSYDPEYLAARHSELLQAIQSHDPERAMHAMQHHIEDLGRPPEKGEMNAAQGVQSPAADKEN
jgi:DNA-binding GntR family transcriptional regulator